MAHIITISLGLCNSYLVIGRRAIIVDSGNPQHEEKIMRELRRAGLQPADVSMLFLTHGHVDHFGSMYALKHKYINAPLAIYKPDLEFFLHGTQATLVATHRLAKLAASVGKNFRVKQRYGIVPELVLTNDLDLRDYGVEGKLMATPGHTMGSASLALNSGQAITGDTLMQSSFFNHGKAFPPPFLQSTNLFRQSIEQLYREGIHTFYPGHNSSFTKESVFIGSYGKEKLDAK